MCEINEETPRNAKKIDRAELLNISSWLVDNLRGRLSKPHFVVKDSDPVKLQYYRVLIQAVQSHNSILRDEELEAVKDRLAVLEATLEGRA